MTRTLFTLWLLLGLAAPAARAATDVTGLHDTWDALLKAHVNDAGRVDYPGMKREEARLDRYIERLAGSNPKPLSRDGQLAYWINAYNAFTIKLILDHYPVESIRDIRSPWKQERWVAGGQTLSLNDIEHEILRKRFTEPRIHFAINCASIGCPALPAEAFTTARVEDQLESAAKRFFRSSRHVQTETTTSLFGGEKKVLHLSSILKWFSEDFTDDGRQAIQTYVVEYADTETVKFILSAGDDLDIDYLDYNWNLNTQ